MPRDTTTHGPRLDDALKSEMRALEQGGRHESRSDEGREKEDVPEELETMQQERTELARHLRPSSFPGRRDDLVAAAEEDDAPAEIVARLRRLPENLEYHTMHEVWVALHDPGAAARGRDELREQTVRDPLTSPEPPAER
jgi:hypothetical protein